MKKNITVNENVTKCTVGELDRGDVFRDHVNIYMVTDIDVFGSEERLCIDLSFGSTRYYKKTMKVSAVKSLNIQVDM